MIWLKPERNIPVSVPNVGNKKRLHQPVVKRDGVDGGSQSAHFESESPDLLVKNADLGTSPQILKSGDVAEKPLHLISSPGDS